jgi:hypothetical protein
MAANEEACRCHTCRMCGTCTKNMASISYCRWRARRVIMAYLAHVNQINTFTSNHLSTASDSYHTLHPGVTNQRLDHQSRHVLITIFERDVEENVFQIWLNKAASLKPLFDFLHDMHDVRNCNRLCDRLRVGCLLPASPQAPSYFLVPMIHLARSLTIPRSRM